MIFKIRRQTSFLRFLFGGGLIASLLLGLFFVAVLTQHQAKARTVVEGGHTFVTQNSVVDEDGVYKVSFNAPEIYEGDENTAIIIFLHYRSFSESVTSIDIDSGSISAVSQGEVIREDEYSTEAWVATGAAVGIPSIDVYLSGGVDDFVAEAYYFSGVDQADPVGEVVQNSAPYPAGDINLTFTASDTPQMYVGAATSYTDSNTVTPVTVFDWSHDTSTTNTKAVSGYLYSDSQSAVSLDWEKTADWPWSAVGIALRDVQVTPPPTEISYSGYSVNYSDTVSDEGDGYKLHVDGPEVVAGSDNQAYVILVHYRSYDQEVSSVDVGLGSVAAVKHGSTVRENEYSTEAWVATNLPEGVLDVDVYWSAGVEDAVVEVYSFNGVDQTSPVAEVISNHAGTDIEQPNLPFSVSEYDRMYVGAVTTYEANNTLTPGSMDDHNYLTTTNTYAASGYYYAQEDTEVTLDWTQSTNWHWSGIGLALRRVGTDTQTPSIVFDEYKNISYQSVPEQEGECCSVSFAGIEVLSNDVDSAYVIFVHYRSETESVNYLTLDPGPFSQYKYGNSRESEYATEVYVVTGIQEGTPNVTIEWTGPVEDVVIEVYKFDGVDQSYPPVQPVAEVIENTAPNETDQPNLTFSTHLYDRMYVGAVTTYEANNTLTPGSMDDHNYLTTTNTYAASGYRFSEANTEVTLEWTQSTNWAWSAVGVALRASGTDSSPLEPALSFTEAPAEGSSVGEVVRFAGSISSTHPLTGLYLLSNHLNETYTNEDTDVIEVVSDYLWNFDIEIYFYPGETTINFSGYDDYQPGESQYVTFNFTVVESDAPECILENLGAQISDTTPTYTAACTSSDGVSQASYRIYHEVFGTVVDWADIPSTTTGNWGDSEVSFSFTSPVELDEGAHLITIDAKNSIGKWISPNGGETVLPVDRIVVEADDNRAPRLHVNTIEPNPTSDIQPFLTGICTDDYETEVNSFINEIEYNLNSSGWTSIYSYSAETEDPSRIFEAQMPQLAVGQEHVIEVRCSDTAGNSTSLDSQTIEVVEQVAQNPDKVIVQENFITQDRKIPFYTDAIWGNGYLRLKEQLSPSFTELDGSGYMTRYGSTLSASTYAIKKGTDNLVWYVKQNEVVSYNLVSQEKNTYTSEFFGVSGFNDVVQVEDGGGNHLVWIAYNLGFILFDVSSNSFIVYPQDGFGSGLIPNRIVPDTRDGRIGAYMRAYTADSGTNSNIAYIDTNGTFLDSSDDIVAWFTTPAAFDYSDIYSVTLDEANDVLYMGKLDVGLIKVSDNGTPTNTADYTGPITYSGISQVTDIVVDGDNDAVFFTTSTLDNIGLYVITDIASDPWDFSGQTVTQLANGSDFSYQHLLFMHFLEGPAYVGNQLFIGTDEGRVFYYNTNNTYSSTSDDTLISLDLTQGRYPLSIGQLVVADYNTLLVSYDRLGVYRVDLGRGWDTQNAAVVLAPLPTHRLNINNITLEALNIATRIDSQGDAALQSQATAMPYYTLDDGTTWTQLVLGETQNFDSEEYRLRFKIDLSQNPGTTPIVDEFNVAFGAYQTDPAIDHFSISVQAESKWTDENFQFTIEAQDFLNYPTADYSGSVNIKLYNANTSQEAPFSPSSVTVENGTATVSAGIAQAGDYYIVASSGDYTGQSENFTINLAASNAPVPSMNFTADRYTINKGETVTLIWTTQYFDSVSLSSVGSVDPVGTLQLSPESATAYTLSGTSAYGTITSSLTIAVNNSSSTGGVESVSESTSSTGTGTSSSQTSTTSGGYKNDVDSQDTEEKSDEQEDQAEADKDMDGPILINLESSNGDLKVKKGEKVRIEWDISGSPDSVYLDYWDKEVSPVGYFEFIAEEDTEITLTATKDGQGYSKTIKIGVQSGGLLEDQGVQLMIIIGLLVSLILATFIILSRKKSKKKENRPSTNKQIH